MHLIRSAIAGILALLAVLPAAAQQFPNVPGRSVIGRLGLPGDTGPSQAIPFTILQNSLTTYTAPYTGAIPRTMATKLADSVSVKDFGARCDGSTDDTAAIQAALNTGKAVLLPDHNAYCKITSSVNITLTGTSIIGSGQNSSGIRITSTSANAIAVAPDVYYVTLSGFAVYRTGTPTTGANGIIFNGDTQQANLSDLWIEGHWNGLAIRTTGYSTIRNVVVSRNFNDGLNCTDMPGHGGFQWYINGVLSQLNAHNGFTFATGLGTLAASVGNWDGLYSFANTNFGFVVAGTAGQPIPGLRLLNSFFGQDGQGEILIDSFGGIHNLSNIFLELAGTSTTGPTFSTAASGVGNGLNVSANNTDIIISGLFSTANSQSGAVLNATVMNSLSNSRLTLNLGYGASIADGSKTVLNTTTFAGNVTANTLVSANASSLVAAGNSPSSLNSSATSINVAVTGVLNGVTNGILFDTSTAVLGVVATPGNNNIFTTNGSGVPTWATPGTGVLTALGVNVGSAGAFTTFNGAHGTPSSITLTNATGLPVSSITGVGQLTISLGADVLLNNTANYFDGPSIAQGTTGTWWVAGTVSVLDTAASASIFCKLWDGTTVIASAVGTTSAAAALLPISLSGFLASPAANIRISCRDGAATTGKIIFNSSGNSKDSTISAHRIQ